MIRSRARVPLVVGFVAVLGACGAPVSGVAVPVPNPTFATTGQAEPSGAEKLLGDLPTVDPCGQIEPADLSPFGSAVPAPAESLDYCLLTLTTPSGTALDVAVGLLDRLASEREIPKPYKPYRDLRIAAEPEDTGRCARLLVFADLVTLSVTVNNYGDGAATPTELCDIADRAVEAVADRVVAEEVAHRTFPAGSLGKIDPCDSVSAATVGRVPGLESAEVKPYPAAHQCRWSTDGAASLPRVRVMYSIGIPAEPDGKNVSREDVGGRSTAITDLTGSSTGLCAAETTHIPFDGGAGLSELATVIVSLPAGSQPGQACAAAKAVAAEAWADLP